MRMFPAVLAAALLVAGCTASAPVGDASVSPGTSAPVTASPAGPSVPTAAATPVASSASGPFTLVSQGLAKEGAQVVLDAAGADTTVVASVLSQTTQDDYDAGLVYSTDSGSTWAWGGVVADEGKSYPEAVALVSAGAIMVGTNQVTTADAVASRAFLAAATFPDFVPRAIQVPAEFDGDNVHLQDIDVIDGDWVISGYLQDPATATEAGRQTSVLWRSSDQGTTWTRQVVEVTGSSDNSIKQLVIAPDGSWNAVGMIAFEDSADQYDPMWLRSTDAGATFTVMDRAALSGPFDQGASKIVFAADGAPAILGWDEVTDNSGTTSSALWTAGAGQPIARVGTTQVPVLGGTPPGEFIDGILWDGATLAAWGSPTGAYPMDNVQFWGLVSGQLTQSSMLPGNGTPIAVGRILVGQGEALAFGFSGAGLADAEVAIWKGDVTPG